MDREREIAREEIRSATEERERANERARRRFWNAVGDPTPRDHPEPDPFFRFDEPPLHPMCGMMYEHPDGELREYPPPLTRGVVDTVLDLDLSPERRAQVLRFWKRRAREGRAQEPPRNPGRPEGGPDG